VRIRLTRGSGEVHLEIRDYGRGFDPHQASAGGGPGERVGIAGMQERVAMLGGELTIRSEPEAGTCVLARIPLSAPS
jgi:signal transduction histidine kinase